MAIALDGGDPTPDTEGAGVTRCDATSPRPARMRSDLPMLAPCPEPDARALWHGGANAAGADDAPRVCVFGAAPDTGNLGVSALCESLLDGLWDRSPRAQVTVFDHGRGARDWAYAGMPSTGRATLCGAVHSRRVYRSESLWRMWAATRWGVLPNRGVERIRSACAVLDVSGGDSFTDLYGPKRFGTVTIPKLIALESGRPLVLLPQTYGPFASVSARRTGERIVQSAAAAWARDERSFAALRGLLGDAFDPARHRCTVDMAFGLRACEPQAALPEPICGWLSGACEDVVGVNVSGLVANQPGLAAERFGLRADYRELVSRIVGELLHATAARVVLIPHVHAPVGHPESDLRACLGVMEQLPRAHRARVAVLPPGLGASETKWVISRMSWVCATRMHACIAGLSSGVPVAGIAYSDKARGVFETCAQGESLIDPRELMTEDAIELVVQSYHRRAQTRRDLAGAMPRVQAQNQGFFDDLMGVIAGVERRGGVEGRAA